MCLRYRYDYKQKKRYKTVELIIEELDGQAKARATNGKAIVGLQVGFGEKELQERIKRAGGGWNPKTKLWEMRYDRVVEPGIERRVKARSI